MAAPDGREELPTHHVQNQPPAVGDRNLWADDPLIRALVPKGTVQAEALSEYGQFLGTTESRDAARAANRHAPELRLFDPGGRRLDEVIFHPAYHRFMTASRKAGYHSVAWDGGGHLDHALMVYLASQTEPGHCCPLTMTYAGIALARRHPLPGPWLTRLMNRDYDPTIAPVAEKGAATLGMAMTEKQGGSDVRANTTRAERDGDGWRLTGHKWFCSAPMSDGFLTLAQTPRGLSCFLVPRWLADGRNAIAIQRLKDKLGNRSNASAEIEYQRAFAVMVGEEGAGIRTIVEMVHHTRLDTALAPAGLMRTALREAHHWLTHRNAFQRRLIDQPLMRAVLADLTLDWAGAVAIGLEVAQAFDGTRDEDRSFARLGVAVAKYLNNKLCPMVVVEAMEMLGGMGYVEDTPLPMLYREAPLNGIWEGSGNVMCLDILRTLARDPLAAAVLNDRLDGLRGMSPDFDRARAAYHQRWGKGAAEAEARWFVEDTARLLSAGALLRAGATGLAEDYLRSRVTQESRRTAGALTEATTDRVLAFFGV